VCEYTDTADIYTKCKEEDVKHNVAIRAYLLCDKAKPACRYCSNATTSRDAIIGSSKTGGDCPTCKSGVVEKTVGLIAHSRCSRLIDRLTLDIPESIDMRDCGEEVRIGRTDAMTEARHRG